MSENNAKVVKHKNTKEEAAENIKKMLEVGKKMTETKEETVNKITEPLSMTIEKAKRDINTAVIAMERNYGLHSSITVLILESVLANVRAGNAVVAAAEFEQYKRGSY